MEKITGTRWDKFATEALVAYFAWTDRGQQSSLFNRVWRNQLPDNKFNDIEQDLWDLMQSHTFHPVTVEMWKEDFRKGLLFLSDFAQPDYPDAYKEHAKEIFNSGLE